MENKKSRVAFRASMSAIMAILLVVLLVGNYLATVVYYTSINNLFTVAVSIASGDATEGISTVEDRLALCLQIEGEGVTLLKNDGVLPLSGGGVKVNLIGQRAYDPVYGGTGSGGGDSSTAVNLVQALNENGFEVNPALENSEIYKQEKSDTGAGIGFMDVKLELTDPDISAYKGDTSFESMKAYSDIAIVVFGRAGGEGSDLTKYESPDGRHYLQLSTNEEALIQKASETFDTVIVLYNGANALELGFLETYGVDAALWIGDPGVNGLPAVAQILNGTINPSGRLTDTYAYDATSAPSWNNFGDQEFTNTTVKSVTSMFGTSDETYHYVDYVEGIYVGYRWYETAAVEGFIEDYDSVVQYPFGYGLSYTNFSQEIVDAPNGSSLSPTGDLTVNVKVTNTGDVAGKEVVQLYTTSPYTDYDKANGVEKSAVDLAAYGKTKELAPGESETISLTIQTEDIASYDESHANADGTTGSYMLDAGTYTVSLRKNSHTVIDSFDVTVADQYFYSGDNKKSDDQVAASNQLQDAKRGSYLSRNNGFANYEEAMASVESTANSALLEQMKNEDVFDESMDELITKEYVAGKDYGKSGKLTIAGMAGLDYDDPQWDELIAQMTVEELVKLVTNGGWSTAAIESIGKPATIDLDGPTGLNSMFDTSLKGVQYPGTIVLAATWNADLANVYGLAVANEFHQHGVSGWYAPAMNIHRSPFSGRNFEYCSEDPLVSGIVSSQQVLGASKGGLYAYIKHFAFNDQETNRAHRLTTWTNEQAARQIYLKPFEITVKDGGASALMTSMNHIGMTWVGDSTALLTNILRNEWGFVGMTITDANEGDYMANLSNVNAGIRAGQDMWLGMGTTAIDSDSNADIYYLQRAAKNILYAQANASVLAATIRPWRVWLVILDIAIALVIAGCGYLLVKDIKKSKKNVSQ